MVRVKSIRANPTNGAPEGDERIRGQGVTVAAQLPEHAGVAQQVERDASSVGGAGSTPAPRLTLRPITTLEARTFVNDHHRHNEAPTNMQVRFAVGLFSGDELVGVATAGQPVARGLCDGFTLEINRTCLAGEVGNGNSRLYGAICRAAKALGYKRVVTYTLHEESGASLSAAGFSKVADIGSRSWQDDSSRMRYDSNLFGERNNAANLPKWRWERVVNATEVPA